VRLHGALPAFVLAVLLSAAPGAAARAAAQAPPQWKATVTASVLVAPPPILLTTTRDLYFGNVGQGQVVSVPAQPGSYPVGTWAAGARFGNLAKTVKYGVTFVLPTQLTNGTSTMAVSWNGTQYGWICIWNQTVGTPGVCGVQQANFNPSLHTSTPLTVDLPNNTPQNHVFAFDMYIGGQLTVPTGALKPGTYSAPLRITVAVIN
jgi:hypothetical protein